MTGQRSAARPASRLARNAAAGRALLAPLVLLFGLLAGPATTTQAITGAATAPAGAEDEQPTTVPAHSVPSTGRTPVTGSPGAADLTAALGGLAAPSPVGGTVTRAAVPGGSTRQAASPGLGRAPPADARPRAARA